MAKLSAGILSKATGKVGNVVAGNWKDVNYIRVYAIPSNPNTVAQQVVRSRMGSTVAFARGILGQVLQPFLDPFTKKMSAYNRFVSANIAHFTPDPAYDSVRLVQGTLFNGGVSSVTADSAANTVTISYSDAQGINGAATDTVVAVAFNEDTQRFGFSSEDDTRTDGSAVVPLSISANDVIHSWLFFVSRDAEGRLLSISDDDYGTAIA